MDDLVMISEAMNPVGANAKGLEHTARRALWLDVLCGLWLAECSDDNRIASRTQPHRNLPSSSPNAKRYAKAVKGTGAWDSPSRPVVIPKASVTKAGKLRKSAPMANGSNPAWSTRWDWEWVYSHWADGGLRRSIDDLMKLMPEENRDKLGKEFG